MKGLLLAAFAVGAAARSEENPLGKVLSLLDGLVSKLNAEAAVEEKAYQEYAHWCVDAERNKGFEITELTTKKESLEAAIGKYAATIDSASTKIEELAASIATATANLKDATGIREKEVADFTANEKELTDTIDTLSRAIGVISREMAKNPAFAQMDTSSLSAMLNTLNVVVEASSFSNQDKSKLTALLQAQQDAQDDLSEASAPAVAAYTSHSAGLVDMLEDLKEKAEQQLKELRKTEVETRHSYEMLKQSLEDQMAADNKDLDEEKASKAAAEQGKATAEGDLAGTVKALAEAKDALESLQQGCRTTTADHEATVEARNEELKVIAQAKSILESSTGGAVEQAYSFLQVSSGSRMQTRADLANAEFVAKIKTLAQKHHSAALSQLASRLSALIRYGSKGGADPFAKIRELVQGLIVKLEEEARAEGGEKEYCDKEMKKTEDKKAELETEVSKLTSKIDQASAKSAGLKAEVVQLQAELATLAQEQAQLDKIRQETHAAYLHAKSDLEQGLNGVRQALGVLRSYYAAPALLQQPEKPAGHSKASGAGGSIIGILEVVESDFAKSLAREESQESNAQAEYEKTTQENAVTKTQKEGDVKYKSQEAAGLDKTIAELSSDRSTTDSELEAVLEYYAKLKERCIAKPETYEERAQKRADEINGLKDALKTLQEETAFMQRRKHGSPQRFLGA